MQSKNFKKYMLAEKDGNQKTRVALGGCYSMSFGFRGEMKMKPFILIVMTDYSTANQLQSIHIIVQKSRI